MKGKVLVREGFNDAVELAGLLRDYATNGVIYVESASGETFNTFMLVEETLTDGSTVLNIVLYAQ